MLFGETHFFQLSCVSSINPALNPFFVSPKEVENYVACQVSLLILTHQRCFCMNKERTGDHGLGSGMVLSGGEFCTAPVFFTKISCIT